MAKKSKYGFIMWKQDGNHRFVHPAGFRTHLINATEGCPICMTNGLESSYIEDIFPLSKDRMPWLNA